MTPFKVSQKLAAASAAVETLKQADPSGPVAAAADALLEAINAIANEAVWEESFRAAF